MYMALILSTHLYVCLCSFKHLPCCRALLLSSMPRPSLPIYLMPAISFV